MPWLMSAVDIVGPAVPFLSPVFSLVTRAYGAACAMQDVRSDAAALGIRIKELSKPIFEVSTVTLRPKFIFLGLPVSYLSADDY